MNKNDMIQVICDLACNLKGADMPVEMTVFEHHEQVKGPGMGIEAVVGARWHGRSIVIHVGDERWANDMTLAKRLTP